MPYPRHIAGKPLYDTVNNKPAHECCCCVICCECCFSRDSTITLPAFAFTFNNTLSYPAWLEEGIDAAWAWLSGLFSAGMTTDGGGPCEWTFTLPEHTVTVVSGGHTYEWDLYGDVSVVPQCEEGSIYWVVTIDLLLAEFRIDGVVDGDPSAEAVTLQPTLESDTSDCDGAVTTWTHTNASGAWEVFTQPGSGSRDLTIANDCVTNEDGSCA